MNEPVVPGQVLRVCKASGEARAVGIVHRDDRLRV